MTPRFSGSSIFTNILAILPILFLTLNQFNWKTSVATVATLVWCEVRFVSFCPDVAIYFLNRKVLWEFGREGSMSSQLTEPRGGDVLELWSRYTMDNLMPWWANLDQNKLLLNAEAGILIISKQNMTGVSLHRLDTDAVLLHCLGADF